MKMDDIEIDNLPPGTEITVIGYCSFCDTMGVMKMLMERYEKVIWIKK